MIVSKKVLQRLDAISKVLIRCFWLGVILLAIWFFAFIFAYEPMRQVHTQFFSLNDAAFNAINYFLMGATKLFVILVFLIPWIAIRMVISDSGKKVKK